MASDAYRTTSGSAAELVDDKSSKTHVADKPAEARIFIVVPDV